MKAPEKKIKASSDGRYHPVNLLRNWLHQALSYMDAGELMFRVLVESLEIVVIYLVLVRLEVDLTTPLKAFFSVLIAHTINWIFNGNFWALWLFASPRAKNRGEEATVKYLLEMAARLKRSGCIGGLALYGSAARGAWHGKSDLDIRIVRRKGLLNLVCANLLVMRERLLALIYRQPADLFLADGIDFLRKMRADESPLFLIKRLDSLEEEYPGNVEINALALVSNRTPGAS